MPHCLFPLDVRWPWKRSVCPELAFQWNLVAWCRGGLSPGGWTRTGPPVPLPSCRLSADRRELLPVGGRVADFGVRSPVGFRYFRFDGCHRLCCASVLGLKEIPCTIHTVLPVASGESAPGTGNRENGNWCLQRAPVTRGTRNGRCRMQLPFLFDCPNCSMAKQRLRPRMVLL